MNPLIVYNIATLSIAALYYLWKEAKMAQLRRERTQRERVAMLLWAAASRGR